jgi:hypothetical protein
LIEVEERRLDLRAACTSMFDSCQRRLGSRSTSMMLRAAIEPGVFYRAAVDRRRLVRAAADFDCSPQVASRNDRIPARQMTPVAAEWRAPLANHG